MLKLSGGGAGAISQKGKIKNQVSSTPLIITGKSIRYMLHHEGNVSISICNLRGQSLSVLKNVHQTSGIHTVPVFTQSVAKGCYLLNFTVGSFNVQKKIYNF
jgi:hypothetical protein